MIATRIQKRDLEALVQRRTDAAAAAGRQHIRNTAAFCGHLLDVALRAEVVAARLCAAIDPIDAPDPVAAFVAGAWHDGGKIWCGDDFHEIVSALEVLQHGAAWRLVSGNPQDVGAVLRRAAAAIPPGFALYEQWQPDYQSTSGRRGDFEAGYERLHASLLPGVRAGDAERALLLPHTVDALVLMYADICTGKQPGAIAIDFERGFNDRWTDIEYRVRRDDPGLLTDLPRIRARVHDGCALVHGWLTRGYERRALVEYRRIHCAA